MRDLVDVLTTRNADGIGSVSNSSARRFMDDRGASTAPRVGRGVHAGCGRSSVRAITRSAAANAFGELGSRCIDVRFVEHHANVMQATFGARRSHRQNGMLHRGVRNR